MAGVEVLSPYDTFLNVLSHYRIEVIMTENVKPLADWDNEQSSNPNLVWWSRLDNRYQIEVYRKGEHEAKLVIFDHTDNDKVLMSLDVGLSYGAIFGPDVDDVMYWQEMACNFVDSLNNPK